MSQNSGLITIAGGKCTTYRRMAQDTINKAIQLGKLPNVKCKTKDLLIHGAEINDNKLTHLYIYGTDQDGIT